MTTAIKSHVGLVGRQYPELGHYITSPNSKRLPEPLLGIQNIRLRANYLYGEHDPLLHPQPYDPAVPHLPLIPLPELDQILWIAPDETVFQPIDGFKLAAEPIGHLPKEMIEALEHEYMNIVRDLLAPVPVSSSLTMDSSSLTIPSAQNDHKVKAYRSRIQYLLGHLTHEASNFSETLMAWRICQRVCLELRARITWVRSVQPQWGVLEVYRVPSLRAVIGALTDRPEIAENCLRAGIPVWLYRRLPPHPEVIVDHWHAEDKPCQLLKAIVEPITSFRDAVPPGRNIYSGTLRSLERYQRMAEHNEQLAFPGSAFDYTSPIPNDVLNSAQLLSFEADAAHEQSLPPQAGPSTKSSTARPKPYSKPKRPNIKQVDHGRNKFEPVFSPIMPPSIPAWVKACRTVGEHFQDSQSPRMNVSRGYLLPDPGMLGGMGPKLYQPFLKMYLKLRGLLHYRLRKIGVVFASLSNSEWRKILGLGTLKETDGTKTSRDRAEIVKILQQTSNESGLDIDLTKLDTITPEWQGQQFKTDLPPDICREILYEIIHLSFKSELFLADHFLYQVEPDNFNEGDAEEGQIGDDLAASTPMDRFQKIAALPGLISGHMGFGSPNPASRQEAVYNLFQIMRGWRFCYRVPTNISTFLERIAPGQNPAPEDLEHAEYLVVLHYVSTYADYFKRAPIVPHSI
ncbi:hypothetical protein EV361DRAFT_942404 [Lentinula raphanica]|nr:hypothetical protein EV361DRAFT_942404 [Lentinula raphanica]